MRPLGEAITSWPVMPPSSTAATWFPETGSMMPSVWSPLLATSTQPFEGARSAVNAGIIANPSTAIFRKSIVVAPPKIIPPVARAHGLRRVHAYQRARLVILKRATGDGDAARE